MTLDEISDYIVAQRAATLPVGAFAEAIANDKKEYMPASYYHLMDNIRTREKRDAWLHKLAIRALHNQGESYYTQEQS